jgi:protein SCO1/2
MSRSPLRLALLCLPLAGLVTVLTIAGFSRLRAAETLEVFGEAPSFAGLVDQDERPTSADEFRGKVVVANFIYTSCTDICPLLSARMRQLQERLRQENLLGSQVQLLSFSVDPSRDTPEVLRAYAERNGADPTAWRFLTGSEEQLIPLIVEGFHLGVDVLPPQETTHDGESGHAPYEVMHSGRFVLIDRDWRIRAYYDGREIEPERVLRDIRRVLS